MYIYPNKAVMEEHSDEAGAEARILDDVLVHYSKHNIFGCGAISTLLVVTYFKRSTGHHAK
jgi:hypothetical protein